MTLEKGNLIFCSAETPRAEKFCRRRFCTYRQQYLSIAEGVCEHLISPMLIKPCLQLLVLLRYPPSLPPPPAAAAFRSAAFSAERPAGNYPVTAQANTH